MHTGEERYSQAEDGQLGRQESYPADTPPASNLYKIEKARQRQPIEELKRKAIKSRTRNNTWTQEEIDYGHAYAKDLIKNIKWE